MDAIQFIDKHSFFPLHKTHFKTEKKFKFFSRGMVSYEVLGTTLIIAGDPICPRKSDIPKVLDEFCAWAYEQGDTVCGYYFSEYVASRSKCLSSFSAGISVGNKLSDFTINGKEGKEFRRALNFGSKNKLVFKELSRSEYFENYFEIKNLESKWFKKKTKFKRISFLLSPVKIESHKVSDRHFVVCDSKNKILAYVSLDKYREPKKQLSFYVDHMFKHPGLYKLSLDYLFVNILQLLKKEGHKYLDFGFCPFQKVKLKSLVEVSLYLTRFFKHFYNSKGIYDYKNKFCNQQKPVYLLLTSSKSKSQQLLSLFNVTFC